jgi:hypothetical protein
MEIKDMIENNVPADIEKTSLHSHIFFSKSCCCYYVFDETEAYLICVTSYPEVALNSIEVYSNHYLN